MTDNRPVIAHIAEPYLRKTETFIYDRVRSHNRFRCVVLSCEPTQNTDIFPADRIHSAADLSPMSRKMDSLARKLTGASPYLARAARREEAAALLAHFGQVGAAAVPLSQRLGIPLITAFYGHDASAALRDGSAYKRLFRDGTLFSVLSHDMRKRLAEAGCPEDRIRVHRLAMDTREVPPAAPGAEGPLRLITNGRFVEKKGMSYLFEAFSSVLRSAPDARLAVIGEGPGSAELKELAARLGIGGAVDFAGATPRGEVLRMLTECNAFALASVTAADGDKEGTPMALIEAGAAGLPCVTTRHAGNPEVVEDGATGYVVPERDSDALAERILELTKNAALRARMGAAAAVKMRAEFDIRAVMRQMESDIETTLK